ncbi:MAG TPA: hypothetical protein DD412_08665 [Holosporales bacterium]|nr:hypothetical protein [Holosporales bacterium]
MTLFLKGFLGFLTLGATLLMIGCDGAGLTSSENIISSGWARVSNEDAEGQAPLYCYKTIGAPDCYTTPDPRRASQLVSVYPAKNTARPAGMGKIIHVLTEGFDEEDESAIKERELDKVRYYPSPEEKALSRNLEAARRGKEVDGPLRLE